MGGFPISDYTGSTFSLSSVLSDAGQGATDGVFIIDLRPTNPIAVLYDNLNYASVGWNINDVVACVLVTGPQGSIYRNGDFDNPDIIPSVSRYNNNTINLPLDPLTDNENILTGNYTIRIVWYNSVLDEYGSFQKTYQFDFDPPTIENETTSGPYTGILTSTDTTDYGNDVYQITREHRISYPTQLDPVPDDIVSTNAEIQVTPIYTNNWTIEITSFVEYRKSDALRIYWEGTNSFIHCVYGGCIGAMYDAINNMLEYYYDSLACKLDQESYQKRLVIVNSAWHLLNEAYWAGDAEEADRQAYVIQEQVAYSGMGTCGGATSEEVTPCPPWTGGGTGGEYTFNNGLTEAAGVVKLGGTLLQNTTINQGAYSVLYSGSSGGSTVSLGISASTGIQQKVNNGTTEGQVLATATLITIGVENAGTPADSRLYQFGTGGLVESADYKAGYTDRSLVAKDYVDNLVSGIASPESDILDWQSSKYTPYAATQAGVLDSSEVMPTSSVSRLNYSGRFYATQISCYESVQTERGGAYTRLYGYSGIGELATWNRKLQVMVHGQTIGSFDENIGFTLGADYSSAWTDHSFVTKKWVEDNYVPLSGSGTFIGLTDTPASYTGFGTYFLRVNSGATGLEFVSSSWVPATGGTFTGAVTISVANSRMLSLRRIGAGSTPGTPEAGLNLISFKDNDGDEQGYIGIDASGNVILYTAVTGGNILASGDLEVNGDIIVTGTVDGVGVAAWKSEYDTKSADWDTAYGWGDHAGLYQDVDADLTAIAALGFVSTSFLTKTAANTWALDTTVYASKSYVDSLALTYIYVPDSTNVVTSDGYTGDNTDVIALDGAYMQIEEATGTPGFEVRFTFTDVISFNNVFMYVYYHGGSGHTVGVELFNNDTLAWDIISTFTDESTWTIIDIPMALVADYINVSDEVVLRLYHYDSGITSHYLQIDYVALRQTPQLGGGGGITDHGGLTGLSDDDHVQYALADGTRGTYYIPTGTKTSASDAGTFGQTFTDDDYIYVCVQTGGAGSAIWKKIPLLLN